MSCFIKNVRFYKDVISFIITENIYTYVYYKTTHNLIFIIRNFI